MDLIHTDTPASVYRLGGRLTFADNEAMRPVLDDLATGSGRVITLDLENLDYIDSFGVGLIMVGLDEVTKAGNRLLIRNPRGAVRHVFTLANLDTLLDIEDTVAR